MLVKTPDEVDPDATPVTVQVVARPTADKVDEVVDAKWWWTKSNPTPGPTAVVPVVSSANPTEEGGGTTEPTWEATHQPTEVSPTPQPTRKGGHLLTENPTPMGKQARKFS